MAYSSSLLSAAFTAHSMHVASFYWNIFDEGANSKPYLPYTVPLAKVVCREQKVRQLSRDASLPVDLNLGRYT